MQNRLKIHRRLRHRLTGTVTRPRLSVYRSLNNLFVQLIDDVSGRTLAQANSLKLKGTLTQKASTVGSEIAKVAKTHKIKTVVFDRGGFRYLGTVRSLAEAARKEGLEF